MNPGLHPRFLVAMLIISITGLSLLFFSIYTEMSDRIRRDRQLLMTGAAEVLLTHVDEWLDKNIRALGTAARLPGTTWPRL